MVLSQVLCAPELEYIFVENVLHMIAKDGKHQSVLSNSQPNVLTIQPFERWQKALERNRWETPYFSKERKKEREREREKREREEYF